MAKITRVYRSDCAFYDKGRGDCTALRDGYNLKDKHTPCKGCGFYKTHERLEQERLAAVKSAVLHGYIIPKDLEGKMRERIKDAPDLQTVIEENRKAREEAAHKEKEKNNRKEDVIKALYCMASVYSKNNSCWGEEHKLDCKDCPYNQSSYDTSDDAGAAKLLTEAADIIKTVR